MEILEFGNPKNDKIIFIHGFESPYQIWDEYIEYYKKDFCIIVPILTGHNINENTDFISFEKCLNELEAFYISKYGNKVFAIYGMSMGGVLASLLWENKKLEIKKLIMESSPLLGYGKLFTWIMTKQYLSITHKAQARDMKAIRQAVNSMVTNDKLDIFIELLDRISDTTIINYIKEVGKHKVTNENSQEVNIYYLYGSKTNEILFRTVAKFLEKNYSNVTTICIDGKGHCEDALLNPNQHIKLLNEILKK